MPKRPFNKTDTELLQEFSQLKNRADVALLLGVTDNDLVYLLFRPPAPRYRQFEIRKRGGGTRNISAPQDSLKLLQRNLDRVLRTLYTPKAAAHGFTEHRSIVTNARMHRGRRLVLNVDLADFFATIHFGRVRGIFMGSRYRLPEPAARALAQICCYRGTLPQGAPTSPVVSNIVCAPLDADLQHLAAKHACRYTRYADDITFSTDQKRFPRALVKIEDDEDGRRIVTLGEALRSTIERHSFKVNERKVRLRGRGQRQEVTGLRVNEFPNVSRTFVRDTRGMLHAWEKWGPSAAEEEYKRTFAGRKARWPGARTPEFLEVLLGRLAFLKMVKGPTDQVYINLRNRAAKLTGAITPIVEVRSLDKVPTALWVLESPSTGKQGSAFMLQGHGLVSCRHCLEPDTVAYQPGKPGQQYPVRVRRYDEYKDLVTLEISASIPGVLLEGDPTAILAGQRVTAFGFPAYGGAGAETMTVARVTRTGLRLFAHRIFLNVPVYSGNSGGPLLNDKHEVVGIIQYGRDLLEEGSLPKDKVEVQPNAIMVSELKFLKDAVDSDVRQGDQAAPPDLGVEMLPDAPPAKLARIISWVADRISLALRFLSSWKS